MLGLHTSNQSGVEVTAPPLTPASPHSHYALRLTADAVGDLIEFWGFKRVLGRIWTILYLAPTPLSAADISQALELSTGAVSMALKEMEHWGLLIRSSVPGDRQYYYGAESDLWKLLSRVIQQREIHQLERFAKSLNAAIESLNASHRGKLEQIQIDRLKKLQRLTTLGTEAFKIVFLENHLDLASLQKIAQIRKIFQKN